MEWKGFMYRVIICQKNDRLHAFISTVGLENSGRTTIRHQTWAVRRRRRRRRQKPGSNLPHTFQQPSPFFRRDLNECRSGDRPDQQLNSLPPTGPTATEEYCQRQSQR